MMVGEQMNHDRRTHAAYGFAVHAALPPGWAGLAARHSLFASAPWLHAMASRIEGTQRWFVLHAADQPQLGLFGTIVTDPGAYMPTNLHLLALGQTELIELDEIGAQQLRTVWHAASPPAAWFPNLLLTYPGYDCFPVGAGAADAATLDAAITALVGWARQTQLQLIGFAYVGQAVPQLCAALERHAFERIPVASQSDLELPGSSFADYLASLPAKSRRYVRQDRRRIQQRLRENGITIDMQPLAACLEAIVQLRLAQRRKYGHVADEASERVWLEALRDTLADHVTVFIAQADRRVLSFCLCIQDGATWHAFATGSDYTDPRSSQVYFELCYYLPIEVAYARGLRKLSFGLGTAAAKQARGCRSTPVDAWVYGLSEPLRRAVQQSARVLQANQARAAAAAQQEQRS